MYACYTDNGKMLTVLVSVRHCRDLAQHVSRPVTECQISFLGNVYGCLTLKGAHIGRAPVPLDEHSCSGDIVYFLGLLDVSIIG